MIYVGGVYVYLLSIRINVSGLMGVAGATSGKRDYVPIIVDGPELGNTHFLLQLRYPGGHFPFYKS